MKFVWLSLTENTATRPRLPPERVVIRLSPIEAPGGSIFAAPGHPSYFKSATPTREPGFRGKLDPRVKMFVGSLPLRPELLQATSKAASAI